MLQLRDVEKLLDRLAETIQAYVQGQIGAAAGKLALRLSGLEASLAKLPAPRDGKDGKDGASINVDDLRPLIAVQVQDAIARMPIPKDGKEGRDGKSIDLDDVKPFVQTAVSIAVAALPIPKDGKDGRDGEKLSIEDVRPIMVQLVEAAAKDAVEALPKPRDGRDGKDGKTVSLEVVDRLVEDRVALAVAKLPPTVHGKDGESVHPDTVKLMVREAAEQVAAELPKPRDGKDGFSLEDFTMELSNDGRTLKFLFAAGGAVVERTVKLATMIYREVWRASEYERGDVVTWGGSSWHCQRPTTEKPAYGCQDWKLMVKEGRPGKDADKGDARPLVSSVARLK